ncbi:GntR family transcriptional regulator [Hyphococcus sp.]|uniref:GntR family transcriptional regulator n=1 Tax=Hyphococcus sp. TaxID=2038636 RepID=UPI003D115D7F
MNERSHHAIREAIRERISSGEWAPGALMPGEADFADEYRCARTTVNRALQSLAEDGLIERKRRAGTRLKEIPVKRARFDIPLIRQEVEASGAQYRPHLLLRENIAAPGAVAARLHLKTGDRVLHLQTVHLADGAPYAFEDRWVNIAAAPGIVDAPLNDISANEWLLKHAPYSSGDVAFSAAPAGAREAAALDVPEGAALFIIDRTTWLNDRHVTTMRLHYRPGHKLHAAL